ncbi:MAG TPA: glycosyltransferase family 2 protein [Chitinophagaceae bacterium]|nr:glycosyltransferase family 2 protein [Chitinophagaceae bacterium]
MQPISVVIICRNEAHVLGDTLESLQGLSDDLLVYDNGSTDGTQQLVRRSGGRLVEGPWEGYGLTKQRATALARYDWILCLDADELPDPTLKMALLTCALDDPDRVYEASFRNFYGQKWVRYGEWGRDRHIRLFNRTRVRWNDAIVHEELILPPGIRRELLKGWVLHRTVENTEELIHKNTRYALLNAEKYFRQGKRVSWIKIYAAPGFAFLKYYLLRLGFLDGWEGFVCARTTSYYTFLKYARLRERWRQEKGRA